MPPKLFESPCERARVLPVYNGADTLCRCLASLDAQDLPPEEFGVVAVDDGSTDRSGELLDRYALSRPIGAAAIAFTGAVAGAPSRRRPTRSGIGRTRVLIRAVLPRLGHKSQ
jgi:glycosyltransferase involved in cell wall biosynthesis